MDLDFTGLIDIVGRTQTALLDEPVAHPQVIYAYRIYSEILESHIWVVKDQHDLAQLRAEGIQEPIYTYKEIELLKGTTTEALKTINEAKKVFTLSEVISTG